MMMIVLLEWLLSKFILDIIKKLMLLINGFQNGSTGTIYIPTNQELHICNEDILVEGMPNVSVKNVDTKTVNYFNNIEIKRLTARMLKIIKFLLLKTNVIELFILTGLFQDTHLS